MVRKTLGKILGTVALAGALLLSPVKKADAGVYLNEEFCNLADSSECDFQSSGSYGTSGSAHLLEYTDTDYGLNNFGRSFTLYGAFNINEGDLTLDPNWQLTSTSTNSDSSKNYYFDAMNSDGIITPLGKSFGLGWINGTGMDSADLDSYWMAEIGDGFGKTFRGYIPATDSVTSNLAEFQKPAPVVPEPISSALFLAGGGVLAGRRYMRKGKK